MSNSETKAKRKYTKTPRWTIEINGEEVSAAGLIEVLRLANDNLRDGSADSVVISRIKKDA